MNAKRKSKAKKWITTSVIAFVIIGMAITLLTRPAPMLYESVEGNAGDITTYYSFSGNVETKNRQTVISEKVMQISEILVKEGDMVKEGDVLIKTSVGDEIKSKIDGEVANISVEEQAQVMGGIKLLQIVDYDNLEVSIKVDEYDISALEKGKEATVRISALDKEIQGKISSVSKEGQVMNGVTFFLATVDLEKDENIKVGMSTEVKLISDRVTGAITLPMTVIQFDDNNKPYVLKRDEKGEVIRAEITTGINDGTVVEIKSGVSEGEAILYGKASTSGSMRLSRGRGNMNGFGGGGN